MYGFWRLLILVLLFVFSQTAAFAQRPPDLSTGVTDEAISVASDYQGARLTVFGVHWRQNRAPHDIVVVLRGPGEQRTVRQKRQVMGLWVNADPVQFSEAPSYFAIASTRPIADFLDPGTIWTLGLDPGALARLTGPYQTPKDSDAATYRRALVRLMQKAGLYVESSASLKVKDDGVFKMTFKIPANAPIGVYRVSVFLFRNGRLVREEPSEVVVARIGAEKAIFTAAQTWPALYGIGVVVIAVAFGWAASFLFSRR